MSAARDQVASMLRVAIRPARMEHIAHLAPRARELDRRELWSGWRHTPEQSLRQGVRNSTHAWTGFIDFEPVCMFGVVPASLLSGTGAPWLIGSEAIERHAITFLRRSRPQVARMRASYQLLANYVALENVAAQRWLQWLGFTLEAPVAFGPDHALFRPFSWSAPDV